MKSTTLLAAILVVVFVNAAKADPQPLEDFLTATLLKLKTEMSAGIPAIGLPPMDPYPLDDMNNEVSNDLADLVFKLKDAAASGFASFDPRTVSVVDDKVEIRLALPSMSFSGHYSMSGQVLGFPVKAKGAADVALMDVEAVTTATLNVTEFGIETLVDVQTQLMIGSSLLMLQRYPAVDEIVREVLQRLAQIIFLEYRPALEAGLNEALTKSLNVALAVRKIQHGYALDLPERKVYEAGNANEFIDHMISTARPSLVEKDPLTLPEATKGFEKMVLGIRVHGEAKIYDGFLAGIQTIHRTGDAEMNQSEDMTTLSISAHMGMSNMHGHYRMHAKFMNIGPTGEVSLKVSMVSCELKINVDMSSGKPKATLDHFDISYIGKIELYFDGLGPLDWLINPLGGWIINLVKHKIADAVEGPLKQIIQSKMDNADIPIGF